MSALDHALRALRRGEVVGLPTDTVYGIAADPWNRAAVFRLFEIKGRPEGMPIAILAADVAGVERLAVIPPEASSTVAGHWPGPLTLVLKRVPGLPVWMGDAQRDTIGVRIPDHPVALDLLRRAGPLAVTSANRSGEPPALDDREAADVLGDAVGVYLRGRAAGAEASTVVDLTTSPGRLLRRGPIAWEDV